MKLPKNIATMTDEERYRWWSSLSGQEADRLVDRTFVGPAEYWTYWLEDGDMAGPDIRDTLAEAMAEATEHAGSPACRIERVVGRYSVADAGLIDRDYEDVYMRGEFPE